MSAKHFRSNKIVSFIMTAVIAMNLLVSCNTGQKQVNPIDMYLSGYEGTEAAETYQKPDILIVMEKGFWNLGAMPDTRFLDDKTREEVDLMINYRRAIAKENAVYGHLLTPCYGSDKGVDDERVLFEVLTGLTLDRYSGNEKPWKIKKSIDTYISMYQNDGYTTVDQSDVLNSYYAQLGFDDHSGGKYADIIDMIGYAPALVLITESNTASRFRTKAVNDKLFEHTSDLVDRAANIIRSADESLVGYMDYVDQARKDTVLVWFGDQLPNLGTEYDEYGAYVQSGMFPEPDMFTEADYTRLHTTEFLIYANFPLAQSEILGGKTGSVASYNLLNVLAEVIGAPMSPMMQFLKDIHTEIPYYNRYTKRELSEEQTAKYDRYKAIVSEMLVVAW